MNHFRKIVAIMIMICTMFSMNLSSLALSHTSNPSTTTGALSYDSSVYDVVNAGSYTMKYKVTSFTFHGGMPANTVPTGHNFTVRFQNTTVSRTYSAYNNGQYNVPYSVNSKRTICVGISSSYSSGVYARCEWDCK